MAGKLLAFRRPDRSPASVDPDPDPPGPAVGAAPAVLDTELPKPRPVHRPILPTWVRDRSQRRSAISWAATHSAHTAAFHAVRLPRYGLRLVASSPRGAWRVASSAARWAFDADGLAVQRHAMASLASSTFGHERSQHAHLYRSLAKEHGRRVMARLIGALVALVFAASFIPAGLRAEPLLVGGLIVGGLGFAGRRRDRPLLDATVLSNVAARKLTADMVVRAFVAARLCKEDNPISFAQPIARDGKGWVAVIDLPYGAKASDAVKRREDIAAGLDIDEVQVFLSRHRGRDGSARRISLWVADEDPYAEKPPASPLAHLETLDFWKGFPFGLDARRRPVNLSLVWSGLLVGAIPRMGKTYAARLAAAAAALDPHVRLLIFDGKGGKDWQVFEGVAHRRGSGVRRAVVEHLVVTLRELVADMNRRYETMRTLPNDRCPEGKLTPALSRDRRLDMPLILLCIDEVQRYLEDDEFGSQILSLLIELAKVGPAAGIMLVIATQRPDSKTLPEGLRGQIGTRFALRVMNWQASDCILGAGAYPELDASKLLGTHKGVGILLGADDSELAEAGGQVVRTHLLDSAALAKVIERGRLARAKAGTLTGVAAGEETMVEAPARELLADVREVFGAGEAKLWSETIAARLAAAWPEAYDGWTPADLGTQLGRRGVRTIQVWGQTPEGTGANRKGVALEAVTEALAGAPGGRP